MLNFSQPHPRFDTIRVEPIKAPITTYHIPIIRSPTPTVRLLSCSLRRGSRGRGGGKGRLALGSGLLHLLRLDCIPRLAESPSLTEVEMSRKRRRERCRSDGRGGRGRGTWRGRRAGLHEGGWRRRSAGLDDGREFLGDGSWRRKGKSFSQRVSCCCCRLSNPASLPTFSLSSVCAFSPPSRPPDSLAERVLGFVQVLVSSAPYHQLLARLLTNPSLLPSLSLLTCVHGLGCKLREAGAAADKAVV